MLRSTMPFALALLAGCGPAAAATRDFPVAGFDRVTNATPFDVHVHTGGAPAVRADGPDALLDRLSVVASNGTLAITTRRGGWLNGWNMHGARLTVTVNVPSLRAVTVAGPGDMTVDGVRGDGFAARLDGPGDLAVNAIAARTLEVVLNGPGDITLAGRADTAALALHGPGDIKAAGLSLRDATLSLSGPGDIVATVTGTARGTLSGPGDITVHGGARCAIDKHGPGDVHCR